MNTPLTAWPSDAVFTTKLGQHLALKEQQLAQHVCDVAEASMVIQLGEWQPLCSLLRDHAEHYGSVAIEDWKDLAQTDHLADSSTQLLFIPHTHEYTGTINQLLNTAARILVPDGVICIFGFRQHGNWDKHVPWTGTPVPEEHIVEQMRLRGLHVVQHQQFLYRHAANRPLSPLLRPLEFAAPLIWPNAAAAYMIVGRKACIPLGTKPTWKDSNTTDNPDFEAVRMRQ